MEYEEFDHTATPVKLPPLRPEMPLSERTTAERYQGMPRIVLSRDCSCGLPVYRIMRHGARYYLTAWDVQDYCAVHGERGKGEHAEHAHFYCASNCGVNPGSTHAYGVDYDAWAKRHPEAHV